MAFIEVLEEHIKEQCNLHQLNYALNVDATIEWSTIENKLKLNLFRIFQELLQNVIRHANAKAIRVEFLKNEDKLQLKILDDGIGFQEEYVKNGIGIKNIKSRIRSLKGEVQFLNPNKKGSLIIISVPLPIE